MRKGAVFHISIGRWKPQNPLGPVELWETAPVHTRELETNKRIVQLTQEKAAEFTPLDGT